MSAWRRNPGAGIQVHIQLWVEKPSLGMKGSHSYFQRAACHESWYFIPDRATGRASVGMLLNWKVLTVYRQLPLLSDYKSWRKILVCQMLAQMVIAIGRGRSSKQKLLPPTLAKSDGWATYQSLLKLKSFFGCQITAKLLISVSNILAICYLPASINTFTSVLYVFIPVFNVCFFSFQPVTKLASANSLY